jgi:hypothetical protein
MRNLHITCIGYLKRPFSFYDIDDEVLAKGLQARGHDVSLCDWNDITPTLRATRRYDTSGKECLSLPLARADALLFLESPYRGSPWASRESVYALLRTIAQEGIPSVNPVSSFFEHPDKRYCLSLQGKLPLPKTFLATEPLEEKLAVLGDKIILKPIDGGGGYGVELLDNDLAKVRAKLSGEQLLQEFILDITQGERSLFFFDKQFTYAIIKRPRPGEYKTNEVHCERIEEYLPTSREIAIGEKAVRAMATTAQVQRVDMTPTTIMEITQDCPGTYTTYICEQTRQLLIDEFEKLLGRACEER